MYSTERVGRYRLDRRLGAGGFAVVWLGYDEVLETPVAVKVLAENWAHRMDMRERFLSEARLLRRADSNRVVQVFDIGELPDERPYFVMEYADRGTLQDRLDSGDLPLSEALRLTVLVARAAAVLHAAGIVHRDIKPSNVLFRSSPGADDGEPDRVLLADLGLAKSLAHASGLTMAAGSAGYQPPEQADPTDGIDARADVYALGALGYHLVTGTVPGSPGEVVPPDELRPDLPAGVRHALLRAMEPDREERWSSATEFADELDRLAAMPGGRPAAGRRRWRPSGRALAGTAAVAATALAGGVAGWLLWQSGGDQGPVRVSDAADRISAEVPATWAEQVRDAGWNPAVLGFADGEAPALAVADDLAAWQDLTSPANGVFVGLVDGVDVTTEPPDPTRGDCQLSVNEDYLGGNWQGVVRGWHCPGDAGTFTEAALSPADGDEQPLLYVQIRQSEGDDATDRVLDSLRVGG
ncbi:serine/threonine-protein kinase [Streptomyces sp. DSM 44915]|uniref:non-specific serine/threonine protein kinase n=1 Tax=Streptomyces chisholmiae TaxID=3075540 RepID=A0ABU2JRV0_9ACTN|nr:serine/threonine-protein kinase [Streptomyces sp. DSM 44915]MDT0267687.1 serine/threonine-protein kinase [Streptomyces sp. DSM 44915]